MKKNTDQVAPVPGKTSGDISSEDIENAHAAGDGSMGRNDEKVEVKDDNSAKDDDQPSTPNTEY